MLDVKDIARSKLENYRQVISHKGASSKDSHEKAIEQYSDDSNSITGLLLKIKAGDICEKNCYAAINCELK